MYDFGKEPLQGEITIKIEWLGYAPATVEDSTKTQSIYNISLFTPKMEQPQTPGKMIS